MTKEQNHKDRINKILANTPQAPGVYKMLNTDGEIIYVGKAKDLRKRLQTYFRPKAKLAPRKQKLVQKVADIDYIVVNTELEALVLETNLIKEVRPRYNVLMKDDKTYVYIRVTVNEDFPRISLVRKMKKDGAKYFGPKTAGWKVKQTLKLLKKLFPYRHCRLDIKWEGEGKVEVGNKVIKFPCLDYHIKRCIGPCVGVVTPEEYRKLVDRVVSYLEGNYDELKDEIMADMQRLAKEKKFEQAALLRDKIGMLESVQEKQMISEAVHEDLDVINLVEEQGKYFINLFQVRDGKLLGQENFVIGSEEMADESNSEVLQEFVTQYYQEAANIPKKVLIPVALPEREIMETWLGDIAGHKLTFSIPQKGRKNSLLELALKNAKSYAAQMKVKWLSEEKHDPKLAQERLKEILELSKLPRRIECYDISHLGGTETVGSMVVFENGMAKTDQYRHFRIRSLPLKGKEAKPDDFKSMEEVLTRRLKYLVKMPDGFKLRKAKEEGVLILSKTGVKKEVAKVVLNGDLDQSAELKLEWLDKRQKVDKFFLPILQAILKRFKLQKLYVEQALAKKLPYSFDDLGMLPDRTDASRYVLERYRFALQDSSLNKTPDLIVIDGGKGQLSSSQKALKKFGLKKMPMVALAKKREELFQPGVSLSHILDDGSAEKSLMQRLRDEAHRFAITFNRKSRQKKMTKSQLDDIPGVGAKTRVKLIKEFGSLEAIAQASEKRLAEVTNRKVAKLIKDSLTSDN